MKKNLIRNLPIEVLRENLSRLEISIDELEYFLMTLEETHEELLTTNGMLKNTIKEFDNLPEVIPHSKTARNSLCELTTVGDEVMVSLIIQEEIPMPKRNSLPSLRQRVAQAKKKIFKKNTTYN